MMFDGISRPRTIALAVVFSPALACAQDRTPQLREPHIERNICPFECCQYGEWFAEGRVNVYPNPGSRAVIARIDSGQKFLADSGNMHFSQLGKVRLRSELTLVNAENTDSVRAPSGAVITLLSYTGEGYFNVWYRGRTYSAFVFWKDPDVQSSSTNEPGVLIRQSRNVWWVHVRLPNGLSGWIRMDEADVGGHDACA